MRNTLWTVTALALIAAAPVASADEASKEETIGIGVGGLLGAVAGGPVGFIIGAGIGVKIGDEIDNRNDEIDSLNVSLEQTETTVYELESDLEVVMADFEEAAGELQHMQRLAQPELIAMMQNGVNVDLLFRTDEDVLADSMGTRLWSLAQSLATNPNIRVRLDGFADQRGDADYNQRLSERRVEFVRDQLIAAGVDESRISYTAHGEVTAQDETIDSFALERRVSLRFYIEGATSVASN